MRNETNDDRRILGMERRGALRLSGVVTAVAAVAVGIWWGIVEDPFRGVGAGLAVVIAAAIAALALSFRHRSPEGVFAGFALTVSGMIAWTYPAAAAWALFGVIGLVALIATYPWWRDWRAPLKLGSFWLGVPVWVYGAVSAVAVGAFSVAIERTVYGGYALLIALLVVQAVRQRHREVTAGIAVGLLLAAVLLLIAGCTEVFEPGPRHTAQNNFGFSQADRFWGGPALVYHPNAMAMVALLAAVRLGADPQFSVRQRVGVLFASAFLLYLAESRTAFMLAGVASLIYAVLYIWRRGLPKWRFWTWLSTRPWRRIVAAALLPLVMSVMVVAVSGGTDAIFKSRYANEEPEEPEDPEGSLRAPRWLNSLLSGRPEVWWLMFADYGDDTVAEQAFGNADNTRGYILRDADPEDDIEASRLGADNAFVSALRRGGAIGLLTALVAVVLVVWRTLRRGQPIWLLLMLMMALAQSMTEDELVNTTVSWLVVLAAEAWVLWGKPDTDAVPPETTTATPQDRASPAPVG